MPELTIENVGAIRHLSIPIPEGGGVVELAGPHGSGKTTAITAAQSILTRKNHGLTTTDSAPVGSQGRVEWGQARLVLGKSSKTTGEMEVEHLEGRLDLSMLVDPGMVSEDANDKRRIKALCTLSGVVAERKLFFPIVGGREEFERLISATAASKDDLVEMAAAVKRDLELAARKEEDEALKADGRAATCLKTAEDVDATGEADGAKLQAALEEAISRKSALAQQAKDAENATRAALNAKADLAKADRAYDGLGLFEAEKAVADKRDWLVKAGAEVVRLAAELAAAKEQMASADSACRLAEQVLQSATQHEANMAGWRKTIDGAVDVQSPEPVHLMEAERAVTAARAAVETGVSIRAAIKAKEEAIAHRETATKHREESIRLRDAAAGTDAILDDAIKSPAFFVRDGRLVVKHERRAKGECHYGELSDGERWIMAIDLALDRLDTDGVQRKDALLTLPQRAWEGLQPSARKDIHEHAKQHGVTILTARADDGELRVGSYES